MGYIKFLVKLNRSGSRAQYVKRMDETPIQTTNDRERALAMGKFAAEDLLKTMVNLSCKPELVPVKVSA
jgi:hypothetical protein